MVGGASQGSQAGQGVGRLIAGGEPLLEGVELLALRCGQAGAAALSGARRVPGHQVAQLVDSTTGPVAGLDVQAAGSQAGGAPNYRCTSARVEGLAAQLPSCIPYSMSLPFMS